MTLNKVANLGLAAKKTHEQRPGGDEEVSQETMERAGSPPVTETRHHKAHGRKMSCVAQEGHRVRSVWNMRSAEESVRRKR